MADLQTVQANTDFAKHMYEQLLKEEGNVFFSPISAHAVLAMAYQGAGGSTKEAFAKTLRLSDTKLAADGYNEIMNRLNNVKDVLLHIANKAYIMDGFKLKAAFQEAVTKKFHSEIESVEFGKSEEAAGIINGWVEGKTKGKIQNLFSADSFCSLTRLVLVNAIYFKGDWKEPFDKDCTRTEPFFVTEDNKIDCQMMHKKADFNYKEEKALDAKVLEIPYKNKEFSMVFILPNKKCDIKGLEKKLLQYDLSKITDGMRNVEVQVAIPKFKIEQQMDLNNVLDAMGLGEIFTPKCNLSQMIENSEDLVVSQVIQKAFIEVNEEGAEAAAATGMAFMYCCLTFPQMFYANHPFVALLIQKQQATNPLFCGRVLEPISGDSNVAPRAEPTDKVDGGFTLMTTVENANQELPPDVELIDV